MSLPKQIQEQISQTEALEKQLYGDREPTDINKPVAEVVQPEAKQDTKPVEAVETPPSDEAPAPVAEKTDKQDDDNSATWKQKYKTLQGMYDAEVPRLHGQVKDLNAQLKELSDKFEASQKQVETAEQEAERERRRNLVTDEDRQEFGEDLIEVQRKVAREVAAEFEDKLDAVIAENAKLREQLEQTGSQVTTASFETRLARAVPDFEDINTSSEWIAWLNEVDPMLRAPRMVAAQKAYSEGDVEGVAHYVRLFKESHAQPTEAPTKAKQELESQIQPSKANSTSLPTSKQGDVLTDADVRGMFRKIMELNSMGKADEARKLEAKIDAAYAEGRVVA